MLEAGGPSARPSTPAPDAIAPAADAGPSVAAGDPAPKRILFFGFSITEQPGYVPALRDLLADRDLVVESRAIGGINLMSLPYLHSVLQYERYDHVVFEVTTCRRYAEKAPSVYAEALAVAIDQVRSRGAEPAFVHLYREGVDYADDRMLADAASLCDAREVPWLNLVPQMLEYRRAGLLPHYLRDGIHTTAEGAELYAQAMRGFVERLLEDGRAARSPGAPDPAPARALVAVDTLLELDDPPSFKRGNLVMPLVEIPEGEERRFDVPEGYAFEGFIFLRGPRAGVCEVDLGERGTRKLFAFDQHSYYRRYATWPIPACDIASVGVRQLPDDPAVELVKGERDPGPRVAEICGLLVGRR